jgi:hypothetical protein
MKQLITKSIILISVITLIYGFTISKDEGKVHLTVSKQENGEKSIYEKTYQNMAALKADQELKHFDLLVDDWISNQNEGIVIGKDFGDKSDFSWTITDKKAEGTKEYIIIKKKAVDGKILEAESEKVIKIKTEDGEKVFTITSDENINDDHTIVWMDEDGKKTELNEETIKEMAADGENVKVKKRIEVIVSKNGDKQKKDIIIMNNDNEATAEIEVEVEKEIGVDDKEVIKDKKVWIIKNGKKIELKDEKTFHFKTEGDQITVIVDGEELDVSDFAEGKFMGDKDIFITNKSGEDGSAKQTMNVSVEEKNGDTYIEIDIKRDALKNVTISEIMKTDVSFKDIDFSIKNNLKPSELNYYPNPNDGKFNLKFNLDQKGEVIVKVLDILGNEIYKETLLDFNGIYDNQLDLTGHEKGIYVLQVQQGRKALSRKILIE